MSVGSAKVSSSVSSSVSSPSSSSQWISIQNPDCIDCDWIPGAWLIEVPEWPDTLGFHPCCPLISGSYIATFYWGGSSEGLCIYKTPCYICDETHSYHFQINITTGPSGGYGLIVWLMWDNVTDDCVGGFTTGWKEDPDDDYPYATCDDLLKAHGNLSTYTSTDFCNSPPNVPNVDVTPL